MKVGRGWNRRRGEGTSPSPSSHNNTQRDESRREGEEKNKVNYDVIVMNG